MVTTKDAGQGRRGEKKSETAMNQVNVACTFDSQQLKDKGRGWSRYGRCDGVVFKLTPSPPSFPSSLPLLLVFKPSPFSYVPSSPYSSLPLTPLLISLYFSHASLFPLPLLLLLLLLLPLFLLQQLTIGYFLPLPYFSPFASPTKG